MNKHNTEVAPTPAPDHSRAKTLPKLLPRNAGPNGKATARPPCNVAGHEYDDDDLDDYRHQDEWCTWAPKCVHCFQPKDREN